MSSSLWGPTLHPVYAWCHWLSGYTLPYTRRRRRRRKKNNKWHQAFFSSGFPKMCKDHRPSHLSRGWFHPLGYSCRSCCVIHPASVPPFTLFPSPARSLLPPPPPDSAPLFPNLHSPSSLFPKLMTWLLNALKTRVPALWRHMLSRLPGTVLATDLGVLK